LEDSWKILGGVTRCRRGGTFLLVVRKPTDRDGEVLQRMR
jgi:hypothetical protein